MTAPETRDFRDAIVQLLTAATEGSGQLGELEILRTTETGHDALRAGYQIARWLVVYAAQETGRSETEIIQELALDSAEGSTKENGDH